MKIRQTGIVSILIVSFFLAFSFVFFVRFSSWIFLIICFTHTISGHRDCSLRTWNWYYGKKLNKELTRNLQFNSNRCFFYSVILPHAHIMPNDIPPNKISLSNSEIVLPKKLSGRKFFSQMLNYLKKFFRIFILCKHLIPNVSSFEHCFPGKVFSSCTLLRRLYCDSRFKHWSQVISMASSNSC